MQGRISWFAWSCGEKLRVALELRVDLGDPGSVTLWPVQWLRLHFQCRGCKFNPWSRIPHVVRSHMWYSMAKNQNVFLGTLLNSLKASCCHRKQPATLRYFRIFTVWPHQPSSFTFHLGLQPQRSAVHSLNRQWLGFPAWALHPQFPSRYSQVWSVIIISHCSWTLRALVLERSWVIALSLINPSRIQTPLGSRAPEAWGCAEWEMEKGVFRHRWWLQRVIFYMR